MARRGKAAIVIVALLVAAAAGLLVVKNQRAAAAEQVRQEACLEVQRIEDVFGPSREAAFSSASGPVVVFLGDSYTQGMYLDSPLQGFPYVAADALDWQPWVDGVGGSGYLAGGPCGGQPLDTRLDAVSSHAPDVVVVQAGINDAGRDPDEVRAAAEATLAAVAEANPGARLVVLGPFYPPGRDAGELAEAEAAIQAAAGDVGAEFISVADWTFPVMEDGVHPTVEGHRLIGERLAAELSH